MRRALVATLGASLSLPCAAAAFFVAPRRIAAPTTAPADPAPALGGETFELPAPERADSPASATAVTASAAEPVTDADPSSDGLPSPSRARGPTRRSTRSARPKPALAGHAAPAPDDGTQGSAGSSALYGAVGERSAADLANAFTRGFPQAASGDPAWRGAPLGPAGEAIVTLTLDEAGHIADVQVAGNPSAALAEGVRRTVILLRSRPFVARTKTTTLRLAAIVSSDTVHDGLHGDVFAIGGSFAVSDGSAFFALAIGRRIDLRVRLTPAR